VIFGKMFGGEAKHNPLDSTKTSFYNLYSIFYSYIWWLIYSCLPRRPL